MNGLVPAIRGIVAVLVVLVAVVGMFVMVRAAAITDPQAACDQAVAEAMAIDPSSDTVAAVDGAIARCGSLEAWVKAAQRHPDAFGGQDPTTLARDRCGVSSGLAGAPVCAGVLGN